MGQSAGKKGQTEKKKKKEKQKRKYKGKGKEKRRKRRGKKIKDQRGEYLFWMLACLHPYPH